LVYELLETIVFVGLFQNAWDPRASYGLSSLLLFGSLNFGFFYLSLSDFWLVLFENRSIIHDVLNLNVFGYLFINEPPN
jgi:hypothetical protein